MAAQRLLVLSRHLGVLHARASRVLRDLFSHGLHVEVAGGGSAEDAQRWIDSGFEVTLLPLRGAASRLDLGATPVLTARCIEEPPALIHVVDADLLAMALAVRALVPGLRIVADVEGPPAWLTRLSELPDGTALVPPAVALAERLPDAKPFAWLDKALRQGSAQLVRRLRQVRTAPVDAWLVASRAGEAAFAGLAPANAGRVQAIEYGFGINNAELLQEAERDDERARARSALGVGPCRGLACGVLEPGSEADVAALFDVVDASLRKVPQLKWVLFGVLPQTPRGAARLQALVDGGRVFVLDGFGDRADAYRAADLLVAVMPRDAAQWVMEFGATRAPVVACATPRTALVVRPGESGFSVEASGAPGAYVDAIRALVDQPTLRENMGARGRQLAMRLFDSELMQRRLFRIWDAVLREQFDATTLAAEHAAASAKSGSQPRGKHDLTKG